MRTDKLEKGRKFLLSSIPQSNISPFIKKKKGRGSNFGVHSDHVLLLQVTNEAEKVFLGTLKRSKK